MAAAFWAGLQRSTIRNGLIASVAFGSFAIDTPVRRLLIAEVVDPIHGKFINRWQKERKSDLFYETMRGDVLEIEPRSGQNFELLPKHTTYSAIEPNSFCLLPLRDSAAAGSLPLTMTSISIADPLEALRQLPESSQDCVLSTFAICRSTQPQELITEIYRVLKPGGRLVFVEYCANRSNFLMRGLQYLVSPVYQLVLDINLHQSPDLVCFFPHFSPVHR